MFTDMVGYSALAQTDEAAALSVLGEHNRLLRPIFAKHGGHEVKTVGDAFLVEFASALDAIRCSVEAQQTLHDRNASSPDERKIRIRIGIHVGDVVETDGDVLGDAVNIASRIEPLAPPEGISLTQQVYDQVQNKIATPIAKLPPVALKNIRIPMTVYRIVQPWEVRPAGEGEPDTTRERSLAVLPLANISPDPNDEYFADGLTEELISTLSQVRDLRVIARTSVVPYKTAPKSIAQVGAELGVESILEGSVRKAGNRIRITLQLVDARTQRHIWASSYNREIDDVFAVQTDIADRTAEALRLQLAPGEQAETRRKPSVNPAAYDLYLRGLVAGSELAANRFDEAVRYFEEAAKLDPNFAETFAAWADVYVSAAGDYVPMREVMPRARELAARALELDPESSDAHSALGNIALQFDHDWQLGEAEFRKAISLNPSNVRAYRFYGLLLMALERFEEAKEVFRRAVRLDPGGTDESLLRWAEQESGNTVTALREFEELRDRNPSVLRHHTYLGLLYLQVGRRDDALREANAPFADANDSDRFDHSVLNALVGRPDTAREVLAAAERGEAKSYTSATHRAMLYAVLGEKERALDLLEQEYREGDRTLWLWYRGVFFDSLRDDPRFVALLRQYGLPIHPIRRGTPSKN